MDKTRRKRYRVNKEKIESSQDSWEDIPGYEGRYQASTSGKIRSIVRPEEPHIMSEYLKPMSKGSKRLYVKLRKNGTSKEECVMKIVALTYHGSCPPGHIPIHINGCQSDNRPENIIYKDKIEVGKMTGAMATSKRVVKISPEGEIVEAYVSAREAGRKNYMSYQTILDRCNGKIKSRLAPDGYEYQWDADKFYQEGRNDKREGSIR